VANVAWKEESSGSCVRATAYAVLRVFFRTCFNPSGSMFCALKLAVGARARVSEGVEGPSTTFKLLSVAVRLLSSAVSLGVGSGVSSCLEDEELGVVLIESEVGRA
jgi:hypothetical protein